MIDAVLLRLEKYKNSWLFCKKMAWLKPQKGVNSRFSGPNVRGYRFGIAIIVF